MDNEESEAGFTGALNLIQKLEKCEGYLVILPREEEEEKVDLNDYLAAHNREGFEELMDEAIPKELFHKMDEDKPPADIIEKRRESEKPVSEESPGY